MRRVEFVVDRNYKALRRLRIPLFNPKQFAGQNAQHRELARRQSGEAAFDFYGLRVKCPGNVFHPSQDSSSAFLVRHALGSMPAYQSKILEVGTGSGCIALKMKTEYQNATVVGLDISQRAVIAARHNADENGLAVHFEHSGIEDFETEEKYDTIIFNAPLYDFPPKLRAEHDVLCDPDGTVLRAFLEFCLKRLNSRGKALFTVSNLGPTFMLNDFDFSFKNIGYERFSTSFCRALITASI